ncbi:hypothetical protein MLD38_036780 [Melastoma candidum]|uniref:Uncharacterized protein n=1 Tax=Melastoma candidum TaxID=119954 RepID=A0ACB9LKY8_9MYRT|nr:hypothetical protein MLD38_036780 [Melastoma candidum]
MKCKYVELTSDYVYPYGNQGGFDVICSGRDKIETPEQIYSEMIGNVMVDTRSTGKYYHCMYALDLFSDIAARKSTLKNVTSYIVDVICKRSISGYNYGVILIPERLIDFIPEVQQLIAELNEILAHEVIDVEGLWKKKLVPQSLELFEFLPPAIQEQLMLERDSHGIIFLS